MQLATCCAALGLWLAPAHAEDMRVTARVLPSWRGSLPTTAFERPSDARCHPAIVNGQHSFVCEPTDNRARKQ